MITSGERPNPGEKSQSTAPDLTLRERISNRARLGRILDMDHLAIIVTNLRIQAGIKQDGFSR